MRRMMFWLVAVSFLSSLVGCELIHSHGVCDCEEDNHCRDRSPWVQIVAPSTTKSEAVPAPKKLPETTKKDL